MLSQHFLLVLIQTPGGPHVVNALSVSVLSLWLGGFHITRLSEKKRALIMKLQQDAEAAFTSPFHTPDPQPRPQPQPAVPPRPGPESAPPPPLAEPEVVPLSVPELLREVIRHLEQKERNLEAQVARLDHEYHDLLARQAEMQRRQLLTDEQVQAVWAVVSAISRAGAPGDLLSADHQRTLGLLLGICCRLTGRPLEALERELLAAVGVAEMAQAREEHWEHIVGWLRQVMNWGTSTPP